MKLTPQNLKGAVEQNIISAQQAEQLQAYLKAQPDASPSFNFTHVLYYFGGMIAIAAMTLFMNLGWEAFGGWGIVTISLIYAAIGLKLTFSFDHKQLTIPAGICATFVVALTPLTIYGLQQGLGVVALVIYGSGHLNRGRHHGPCF